MTKTPTELAYTSSRNSVTMTETPKEPLVQNIIVPKPQTSNATPTPQGLRHCEARHWYLHTFKNLPAGRSKLKKPKHSTMQKGGWVYIMCSMNNTTLYVGVTSTIGARVTQHKENFYPTSFTAKYNCKKLVYYIWFDTIIEAIAEEKRIKGGSKKKERDTYQ